MRSSIATLGFMGCFFGMWFVGHDGYARLLSDNAKRESLLASADEAIQLAPKDPETHYARAFVLLSMGFFLEAAKEYETTITLRPDDYVLWAGLGEARARGGDSQGAIAAYKQAARLAPYYGQSHWELGELELRSGRRDEAFAELRRAAASSPSFLPALVSVAWDTYAGDAKAVIEVLQPQTAVARQALAQFFVRHGKAAEAVAIFRDAKDVSKEEREALLAELLALKRFPEAYEVWSSERGELADRSPRNVVAVIDGGFESSIAFDDQGFGWKPAHNSDVLRVFLDEVDPRSGAYSLRLEFNGESGAAPVISQLVRVEPKERYQLTFAARTQELVTGGLPVVTLTDANSTDGRMLAQSPPLAQGTSAWQHYTVEFATSDATNGVLITIRQKCSSPCPIFGRVWFDDFSLEKAGPGPIAFNKTG